MVESAPLNAQEWARWDAWMRAQRLLTQEVERVLQRGFGISKAEFSVMVTLHGHDGDTMRVTDLADALDWDKSRVVHLLTRMEGRRLLDRVETGSSGRRSGVALTHDGAEIAERAIEQHGRTVRRLAFERLTPAQAAAIDAWSAEMVAAVADQTEQPRPTSDPSGP